MNMIFPNFTKEYKVYNISANEADVPIHIFNKNYSFPTTDKVNQINDFNIHIGQYVSRITIRKQKLTRVVNENIDVKLNILKFQFTSKIVVCSRI